MADFKTVMPENFSEADVGSVCRICLLPKQILYSIFENEIDILLNPFTPIRVVQNDGYPHQICSRCYKDVKTAYYFKKQCEYAHDLVKSILNLKLPHPKKNISCNLCSTKFCSNSNLKRHLRNLHGIKWEIGTPRSDILHSIQNSGDSVGLEERNFEEECDICGEKFINEKHSIEHICTNNEPDDTLFVDSADEIDVRENFRKASKLKTAEAKSKSNTPIDNILECQNTREVNSTLLKDEDFNENTVSSPFQLIKAPTLKDIFLRSDNNKNNNQILNYLDLMPENKRVEYENLLEKRKIERRKAYKLLKKFSRKTVQSSLLKRKNDTTLNKDGKFECFQCKRCFERIEFLRRHQLSHSNEPKPYGCGICTKLFSESDYLKYHMKNFHSDTKLERPFQCFICSNFFARNKDLSRHVKVCGIERQLFQTINRQDNKQNEYGNISSSIYKDTLNFNEKSYNDKSSYDSTLYNDSQFNEESSDYKKNDFKSNFVNENSTHSLEKPNSKEFLKILLSEHAIDSELMTKKMEDMERNINGKFECEICQKEFNRKAHVRRHYLTHTTAKPFSCEFCSSTFSCPEYVQTHMNRVHHKKISELANHPEIKSELSHYDFIKSEDNRMSDFRQTNNPMNFNFTVRHKMNLKRRSISKYEMLRTQDGKFQCKICHKLYNRAEHVRRHELTHSDSPRPFKCKYCGKEFSRSDNLKKHVETCCVRKDVLERSEYIPIPTLIYKSNIASSSLI